MTYQDEKLLPIGLGFSPENHPNCVSILSSGGGIPMDIPPTRTIPFGGGSRSRMGSLLNSCETSGPCDSGLNYACLGMVTDNNLHKGTMFGTWVSLTLDITISLYSITPFLFCFLYFTLQVIRGRGTSGRGPGPSAPSV